MTISSASHCGVRRRHSKTRSEPRPAGTAERLFRAPSARQTNPKPRPAARRQSRSGLTKERIMAVSANRLELLQIVDAVAREKSIDRTIVLASMEDAMQKAARSRYGQETEVRAEINPKTGEIRFSRLLPWLTRSRT